MIQLFVDRERELRFLEEHYETGKAELLVIYGRRRVGKTMLTAKFMENKPAIYFLADRRPEKQLIVEMKQRMSVHLQDESFAKLAVADWIELFAEFAKWSGSARAVIAVDEFPELIGANAAVPSMFQKIWDQNLKDSSIMLILLGSSVAMMETEVLDYKSPLYGRRTGQWRVEPLKIQHLKPFLPGYNMETLIHVYGCLGGMPAYLQKFDAKLGFWENVRQKILSKGEFLYEEAEFLLREELREPRNYAAILKAIALEAHTYGEILNRTDVERSMLSKYASVLEDLGFIKRIHPVGVTPKPRKGHYVLADNYLRFWFRYVFPNKSELEIGGTHAILEKIRRDYSVYLGGVFGQVAAELLFEMQAKGKLPFSFDSIGKWWFKNSEIDLVALDHEKQAATFIETKWSNLKPADCKRILEKLRVKAQQFKWKLEKANYAVIAKHITDKATLRENGQVLFDLEDFELASA